jgi:ligand-binding sensor domain-containing protein/signal transduction histidine kinase
LLAILAPALASRLPVQVYTTTDGLAQSTVHRIYRDSRGFLWFGTAEGISRYDGYGFQTYREANRTSQRRVREILETSDGKFLLGTENGVCRFEPGLLGISEGPPIFECSAPKGREELTVRGLLPEGKEHFWVASDAGLYRMRTGPVPEFQVVPLNGPNPPGNQLIWVLLRDQAGSLWVGANDGLYQLSGTRPPIRFSTRHGLPSDTVQALAFDSRGRLWAGGPAGVSLLRTAPDANGNIVEQSFTIQDGLPGNTVKHLHPGEQGALWVGTTVGVAEAVRGPAGNVVSFRAYSSEHGLSHLDINAFEDDKGGNLWIGSESGGAMKVTRNGFVSYGVADGLGSPYVMALRETRAGQICAMTRSPGHLYLNFLEGDRFRAVPVPVGKDFYSANWAGWHQVAAETADGRWWIGSERGLLIFPTLGPGGIPRPSAVLTQSDGLSGTHVNQVFLDSHGGVWIVTRDADHNGLTRWDPQTKSFHRFSAADGLPSLERNRANGFAEDRQGQIWIGWWRNGVLRYSNGRFELFTEADGVPAHGIRRVWEDRKGRVWVGSGAGGAACIDNPTAAKPTFRIYGVKEGLSAAEVQALTEDEFGRIYIGTGYGVDRLDPDGPGAPIRHLTSREGLAAGELQTAIRDRKGVLWFGSVQGVSRLVPAADRPKAPLEVFITGLRVNGRALPVRQGAASRLELNQLHAFSDQIQIDFVAPRFEAGEVISYQYRLSADQPWADAGERRSVTFAQLPPGSQSFEVRAISGDGRVSATTAAIHLQVTGPIWRQWWFLLLVTALAAAAGFAFHRYDLNRRLEVEGVRTRIGRDLHDLVGSGLSQIAILSEVAQRSEGKEPVAQIAELSRELIDSMSDIVWAINPARDNLADLAQRMHRFAADLLSARDVALEFRAESVGRTQAAGSELRRQVYFIFRECLSNVARHSQCDRVRICMQKENGSLLLEITDNGVGFNPAKATTGNGIASLRARASALAGTIEWRVTHGTTVILHVPLPE